MALLGLFGRRERPDEARIAAIKDWTRSALGAGEETRLSVSEIVCRDPGCAGTETVILVMKPGERTRALKIMRELAEVTEADVIAACAAGPA